MNDLMVNMSSDVMMSDVRHSEQWSVNHSVKRGQNWDQICDKKRIKEEEEGYKQNERSNYKVNDNTLLDKEKEEWVVVSEDDRKIMNISNQLINFNLNVEDIKWEDILVVDDTKPIPESVPKGPEIVFPLQTGQTIHGYFLSSLVSATNRTAVYIGYNVKKPSGDVIIKIGFEMGFHSIQNEYNIYLKQNIKSVPKILDFLWWKSYRKNCISIRWGYIIMEKCGPNLDDLLKRSVPSSCSGYDRSALPVLNQRDVFQFAIRMIDAIEELHEKGFIHSSLKPDHFLLNTQNKFDLKLIGLSTAFTYLKQSSDGSVQHIEVQIRRPHTPKGDPHFHSIGYHNGYRRSRRDDMESLGYCLVYLAKGTLPWIDPKVKDLTSPKVIRKIGHKMQSTLLWDLCRGLSPQFEAYFEMIAKYEFTDKPDYDGLRNCFRFSPQ